jgi:hypothetical protein
MELDSFKEELRAAKQDLLQPPVQYQQSTGGDYQQSTGGGYQQSMGGGYQQSTGGFEEEEKLHGDVAEYSGSRNAPSRIHPKGADVEGPVSSERTGKPKVRRKVRKRATTSSSSRTPAPSDFPDYNQLAEWDNRSDDGLSEKFSQLKNKGNVAVQRFAHQHLRDEIGRVLRWAEAQNRNISKRELAALKLTAQRELKQKLQEVQVGEERRIKKQLLLRDQEWSAQMGRELEASRAKSDAEVASKKHQLEERLAQSKRTLLSQLEEHQSKRWGEVERQLLAKITTEATEYQAKNNKALKDVEVIAKEAFDQKRRELKERLNTEQDRQKEQLQRRLGEQEKQLLEELQIAYSERGEALLDEMREEKLAHIEAVINTERRQLEQQMEQRKKKLQSNRPACASTMHKVEAAFTSLLRSFVVEYKEADNVDMEEFARQEELKNMQQVKELEAEMAEVMRGKNHEMMRGLREGKEKEIEAVRAYMLVQQQQALKDLAQQLEADRVNQLQHLEEVMDAEQQELLKNSREAIISASAKELHVERRKFQEASDAAVDKLRDEMEKLVLRGRAGKAGKGKRELEKNGDALDGVKNGKYFEAQLEEKVDLQKLREVVRELVDEYSKLHSKTCTKGKNEAILANELVLCRREMATKESMLVQAQERLSADSRYEFSCRKLFLANQELMKRIKMLEAAAASKAMSRHTPTSVLMGHSTRPHSRVALELPDSRPGSRPGSRLGGRVDSMAMVSALEAEAASTRPPSRSGSGLGGSTPMVSALEAREILATKLVR